MNSCVEIGTAVRSAKISAKINRASFTSLTVKSSLYQRRAFLKPMI